ncbi:DUF2232 domain-containing protein [Halobacillus litoralis]|uniref:DUF2232 domain-containing protein n=1 Tax=Halobacillus litoralis TaxID=45668 RepID=A0A845DTC9_9BACI|nr:YybS family protein [Halobacillus litoralis]MYL20666.1 DUF2232 domain-containing protein [Halobacillus litoralis]
MNNSKRITEGALMAGIYLLLLLVIIFLPGGIGSLLLFILPVPYIYYSSRHGWKPGLLLFCLTMIFSVLIVPVLSVPFTLTAGIGGVVSGGVLYAGRSAYESLALGTVGYTGGLMLGMGLVQLLLGINLVDELTAGMNDSLDTVESTMGAFGQVENSEEAVDTFREAVTFIPDIIPSILVMTSVMTALISLWLTFKLMNRIENKSYAFASFKNFRLPTAILWYYFFAMILNYVVADREGWVYFGAINVFIVAGTLIAIQGFSFVFYYASQKKWPKAVPVLVIVFSLLSPGLIMYLVRILGIIDLGFPLRSYVSEKKKN